MSKEAWHYELAKGLVSTGHLAGEGLIHETEKENLENVCDVFDVRVPARFLEQIKNGHEALKNQFVPSSQELIFLPEELTDPIGDETFSPVEGITHRYPNRVLLKPTYLCASYCRFCFRRYKVSNGSHNLSNVQYDACLEYLKAHSEIWEVILSGGDPLVLSNQYLAKLMKDLSEIKHIKIIRFHTRVPSVLPSRVTKEVVQILKSYRKTVWIALHANHAAEFTEECKEALKLLIDNGIPVVLQSVLLKGVNNSFQALRELFETAVENRVRPYYLHYPDLAKGTSHFRISLEEAQTLFALLRGKISGLCLPTFVLDIPGGKGKISAEKSRVWQNSDGSWQLDSPL